MIPNLKLKLAESQRNAKTARDTCGARARARYTVQQSIVAVLPCGVRRAGLTGRGRRAGPDARRRTPRGGRAIRCERNEV